MAAALSRGFNPGVAAGHLVPVKTGDPRQPPAIYFRRHINQLISGVNVDRTPLPQYSVVRAHTAVQPPSISRVCPVTMSEAAEAR